MECTRLARNHNEHEKERKLSTGSIHALAAGQGVSEKPVKERMNHDTA